MALTITLLGLAATLTSGVIAHIRYHVSSVVSQAMSPTLAPGDSFVAAQVRGTDLRRGDVVVVAAPDWGVKGLAVKRVIGIGGDHLTCCVSGKLVRNGQALDEPYVASAGAVDRRPFSVTVPPGRLFLLGDNRGDSIDSSLFAEHDQEQGTLATSAVHERVAWTTRDGLRPPDGSPLEVTFLAFTIGLVVMALGLLALPITWIVSSRRHRRAEAA